MTAGGVRGLPGAGRSDPSAGLLVQRLGLVRDGVPVLDDVSLQLAPGEVLVLLGRNGAGRSSLLQALAGWLPAGGRWSWQGQALQGLPTHQVARRGIGFVPQTRDIFPRLTVRQNLLLGLPDRVRPEDGAPAAAGGPLPWTVERVWERLPALARRADAPAAALSGGEQQLLALMRALLGRPRLLLLDEPTEGLAPAWVETVAGLLQEQRAAGVAVLMVEHLRGGLWPLADRALLLGRGRVIVEGRAAEVAAEHARLARWMAG
ncbi:MAG: hypothetical protein RL223_3970 [Pseudomonadota bacterium]